LAFQVLEKHNSLLITHRQDIDASRAFFNRKVKMLMMVVVKGQEEVEGMGN
jgi:hypothetical protein